MSARHSAFLRRLAYLGAAHGPKWLLRYSPPIIGVTVAALSSEARHKVQRNLVRVRGPAPSWKNTLDTAKTFASFAGSFAESLAAGSKNEEPLEPVVEGREHIEGVLDGPFMIGTIHSGGWDVLGALLTGRLSLDVMVVMTEEPDPRARELHDRARARTGVRIQHVGRGALDALPLLRHLRGGGVVAMQLDRTPPGMRAVDVTLFDEPGQLPEGPYHLARLVNVPIVPIFCARLGFRRYLIRIHEPILVPKEEPEAVAKAAAIVARHITSFVRERPSEWFDF